MMQCVLVLVGVPQNHLRRELEERGLDNNGDKQELANRLLDSLIAQVSVGNQLHAQIMAES